MFWPETSQQTLVVVSVLTCSFSDGFIFGQMSGMLSALLQGGEAFNITEEQISWIASTINVTCYAGFAVGALLSRKFGRKLPVTIFSIPIVISYIMVYFAEDINLFLFSRVTAGVCFGGILFITMACTAEYISPDIRGVSLCLMNAVAPSMGTALGHILSILFHWRTVALIGTIPAAITIVLPLFWVESPSWLATKGRFDECEAAFRILRRKNEGSEKELRIFLDLEKRKFNKLKKHQSKTMFARRLHEILQKTYFWRIFTLGTVIGVFRSSSGKVLFNTFAVTILQDMTGSTDILLFTSLIDSFIVIGSFISCMLLHRFKVRKVLFSTSFPAILFLISLSVCLYFLSGNNIYFSWLKSLLMAVYLILINIAFSVLVNYDCEICPLEIKSMLLCLLSAIHSIFIFLSVKLAPMMFSSIRYEGVFALNSVLLLLCVIYMWKCLPETKGRTLQEIELYFKSNTFDMTENIINSAEIQDLQSDQVC